MTEGSRAADGARTAVHDSASPSSPPSPPAPSSPPSPPALPFPPSATEPADPVLRGGPARERATHRLAAASARVGLDTLVGLAARLLGMPSAQLSLLEDEQLVAAAAGAAEPSGTRGPLVESLCTVTAAGESPLVVTDAAADERVSGLPPVTSGAVGAYLGVPVRSRAGHVVGALCAFGPEPRQWADADVAVLAELSRAASAELELEALTRDYESDRVRWQLAMAAGGVGTFEWDPATGALRWDDRLLTLFGYDRDTFDGTIESFEARVHPDDLARVRHALAEAVERGIEYDAEYRIVVPGAPMRWVHARGTAVAGPDGRGSRVLGAAFDTTRERESDARVSRVLEAMSAAFYSLDTRWRFTYVNAEAERLLGRDRSELLGGVLWELFPEAVGSPFETHYRGAARTGRSTTFEAYYPAPLDGWYELRVWPVPEGISVYFLDISDRRRAEERARQALHAAEAATRRLELLAGVTADLSATLDTEAAVGRLGRHLVPALGDWGIVTLVDDAGDLRDVGSWHTDDALLPLVQRYAAIRLPALDRTGSPLARAITTGRPTVVPTGAAEAAASSLTSPEARELVRRLAPESAVILPLRARGRTNGLITLCRGTGRPPLDGPDLLTARQVAERAGLALDNARLYGQQQRIAEGLQRSLLTEPVEPDHLQVTVRYQPAAAAARVGGDWYDAFLQPDGSTVLVIGDVMGHDINAAAAMSQIRSLLRGIAYATGAPPAQVLATLDAAMLGLAVGTTATAVVVRLEQTPEERSRGLTRVRWSNAGHPPPMLVAPDGTVTPLAGPRNDLILGVAPTWTRTDLEVTVERGSTIVLYTDGLVERRGDDLRDGHQRLEAVLAGVADAALDDVVDEVLARLLPGPAEDDVAVLAVRLHHEDRPRPREAGPNVVPEAPSPAPPVSVVLDHPAGEPSGA